MVVVIGPDVVARGVAVGEFRGRPTLDQRLQTLVDSPQTDALQRAFDVEKNVFGCRVAVRPCQVIVDGGRAACGGFV